ncbi:aminotransferase class V-fold PLP-dependent enzyme [Aliifodinibius sp. S!AR15-10]|uniref:aminotransferase class V-fold PLP-dependent enzyme n=1 Tax=Aliifodinibius sp. S!AR15-10 TaxID=2950437 RepID=UPI00286FD831|nr:aminotransferase class V-fold PLP-dependent enzyme [Aliifodinibius sp. S!AR15-10]
MFSRRKMLKILAGIPLLGTMACTATQSTTGRQMEPGSTDRRDLFEELGVETLINGRGTLTTLSGSVMLPEVREALMTTGSEFARLNEVQDKVGAKIAEMLNCEAAMVTAGAASALTLGTAATITGKDEEMIKQLPNLPGPRKEVIIQKEHRFSYDHAVRNTGIKMIEVEGPGEMEAAINENTVMGLYFNAASSWYGLEEYSISREEFVRIGKKYGIPTFIDAAADVPPVENLFKYIEIGFDLVTFSGGKAIRGPQSTGLLFGREDLIEAAKLNHSPNSDSIGRGMKVNKEEMFAMYVALDSYLKTDHKKQWQEWVDWTERIAEQAEAVPTVKGEPYVDPGPANHFPNLYIRWDQSRVKITPEEVVEQLRNGSPSIEISGDEEKLNITVVTMKPEHVDIVGRRVKEVLEQAV